MASVFSLETEFDQKQVVPFKEAVLGDLGMIKAIPGPASDSCNMILLTQTQVVLYQTASSLSEQ